MPASYRTRAIPPSGLRPARRSVRALALALGLLVPVLLAACGSPRDAAEEHRKLSLRIEHRPPGRAVAGEDVELRARVQSSLEGPRLEAWVRTLPADGAADAAGQRIPLRIGEDGDAVAVLPAHERGEVVRYVIEARDAAGLVVTLPRGADEGQAYTLRFEGGSSRILGGISYLSALLGALLWIGAGAAAAQNLRGRMSPGPAGMLGTFGLVLVVAGLFVLGGIHATLVTGRPWPSAPLFFALSRGDLAVGSLLWAANLWFGRRILLDEVPDGAPHGERAFSVLALAIAILTLLQLLF